MIDDKLDVKCVLDARADVGEGAVWCVRERCLWWVDIMAPALHRFDPASGEDRSWAMPSLVGFVQPRAAGGVVVGLQEGIFAFDPVSGNFERIGAIAPDPGDRFNDATVAPGGQLLATIMSAAPPFDAKPQPLVSIDALGRGTIVADDLRVGNGLAFSPDGQTLYLSESHPGRCAVWSFDWNGQFATRRRLFFDPSNVPGRPDGAAVDEAGGFWYAAAYGWAVVRLTPHGTLDRIIPVPAQKPTKVAFGGPNLATLYVTSIGTNLEPGTESRQPHAGGIFAFETDVRGMAAVPYAG